jgi:hypothetical protein
MLQNIVLQWQAVKVKGDKAVPIALLNFMLWICMEEQKYGSTH